MMQNKKTMWFKVLSWWVGIYHTILGLVGLLASSDAVANVASKTYHLSIPSTVQFVVTARFASAYMLALGIMAMMMARRPKEYGVFIWPIVIMIIFRIYTRLAHAGDIMAAFGGSTSNNLITVAIITLIGIGLLSLRPKN